MSACRIPSLSLVVLIVLLFTSGVALGQEVAPGAALTAAFTYQGSLQASGAPANGPYDFQCILYNAASGGGQVGAAVILEDVPVTNGIFTVELDFGAAAFDGQARWLEVAVRPGVSTGAYSVLNPRHSLTAVPHAIYATKVPWSGLQGIPAGFADGTDNDTTYSAGSGLTLVGTTFAADTNYMQRRVGGTCAAGSSIRAVNADGTVTCETDDTGWSLTGNAGTTPGTHFLGTTDNQALELKVNGQRGLRIAPATDTGTGGFAPNLVGGSSANQILAGGGGSATYGATIAGGGRPDATCRNGADPCWNRVSEDYGTVGGGIANTASEVAATVGGGTTNSAGGASATVSGGAWNTAGGSQSTVGGGFVNSASGMYATVGGGASNSASGQYATIAGGYANTAGADYSFAGGYRAKTYQQGVFVWADSNDFDFDPWNWGPAGVVNSFNVRATGGFYFATATDFSGNVTSGVYITTGGSGWNSYSDRKAKENFAPADARLILDRLAAMPVQTWNYKTQPATIRHIGPMAQDFAAAFGMGENDTTINSLDADGVALAAIQGLYGVVQEQENRLAAQQVEIRTLQAQNAAIEARLAALERQAASPDAGLPAGWLLLGGISVVAAVAGQRRLAGGRR